MPPAVELKSGFFLAGVVSHHKGAVSERFIVSHVYGHRRCRKDTVTGFVSQLWGRGRFCFDVVTCIATAVMHVWFLFY